MIKLLKPPKNDGYISEHLEAIDKVSIAISDKELDEVIISWYTESISFRFKDGSSFDIEYDGQGNYIYKDISGDFQLNF